MDRPRKRRDSDLVLMWRLLCDLFFQRVSMCFAVLHELWQWAALWVQWAGERHSVLRWASNLLEHPVEDLDCSWRDGVLLCALLERLRPGCCPTSSSDPLQHALATLECRFGISTETTAAELAQGSKHKLLGLLSRLKGATAQGRPIEVSVRGSGLSAGFVGRPARFALIFGVTPPPETDVSVEIRGPGARDYLSAQRSELGDRIEVAYVPREEGEHTIVLRWLGRTLADSPYTAQVASEDKRPSVRFREPKVRRRILRYLVRVGGREEAVEVDTSGKLAAALLRLDYGAGGRRRSWGFAGELDRRRSVVRQFASFEDHTVLQRSSSFGASAYSIEEDRPECGRVTEPDAPPENDGSPNPDQAPPGREVVTSQSGHPPLRRSPTGARADAVEKTHKLSKPLNLDNLSFFSTRALSSRSRRKTVTLRRRSDILPSSAFAATIDSDPVEATPRHHHRISSVAEELLQTVECEPVGGSAPCTEDSGEVINRKRASSKWRAPIIEMYVGSTPTLEEVGTSFQTVASRILQWEEQNASLRGDDRDVLSVPKSREDESPREAAVGEGCASEPHSPSLSSSPATLESADEYIDDEILASEYWGDLRGLGHSPPTPPSCSATAAAARCKVFGIAIYYACVAINNEFQVMVAETGPGNLSVDIRGLGRHDVLRVEVAYTHWDLYRVAYKVAAPGYYRITVRWGNAHVPGSPFLCKATY